MATFGLFRLASALLPRMEGRGRGTLGCMPDNMTHLHAQVKRLQARPAFQTGIQT